MNLARLLSGLALLTILIIGGAFVAYRAAGELLQKQSAVMIHRLEKTTTGLLNDAHRANDDLALQGVVRALGQAPGIKIAAVIDLDDKILAHNQPAQLGQLFTADGGKRPSYVFELKDGADAWGHLILQISDRSAQRAFTLFTRQMVGGAATVWFLGAAGLLFLEQRRSQIEARLSDAEQLWRDEKAARSRVERAQAEQQRRSGFWLQNVVDQIPQPVLLLDHQQRVMAINKTAALRLGVVPQAILRKSWQEIPVLDEGGGALGQSLEHINRVFRTEGPKHLQLCSLQDPSDGLAGTWVTVE